MIYVSTSVCLEQKKEVNMYSAAETTMSEDFKCVFLCSKCGCGLMGFQNKYEWCVYIYIYIHIYIYSIKGRDCFPPTADEYHMRKD